MEEKLLNILEIMHKDIADIKTTMVTKEDITDLESKLTKDISRLETRMENEVIEKIRVLYNNREIQSEINEKMLNSLRRIENKVDVLQIETSQLRRIK